MLSFIEILLKLQKSCLVDLEKWCPIFSKIIQLKMTARLVFLKSIICFE